jgi:hypothetical protein
MYLPAGVEAVVVITRLLFAVESVTGIPGVNMAVDAVNETTGALVTVELLAERAAVKVTVPEKPQRLSRVTGTVLDDPGVITAIASLLIWNAGVTLPGHVARVGTVWPGVGSPAAPRQEANSIWLLRLS